MADTPEDGSTIVSISTTFFLTAQHRPRQPDVVLLSKDSVYFYVHSDLLLDASDNGFRAMLPISPSHDDDEPPVLNIPESSPVLNVILHAIYDMSCTHYSPPFETLVNAVDSMPIYGVNPKSTVRGCFVLISKKKCLLTLLPYLDTDPAIDTSLHTPFIARASLSARTLRPCCSLRHLRPCRPNFVTSTRISSFAFN